MTLELKVPDMACSACADAIAKAVNALDPQASVSADPATKQVTVDSQAAEPQIREAIAAAGYSVE